MALRRGRHRRLRFGLAEAVLLALLSAAVLFTLLWVTNLHRSRWQRTRAYATELALEEGLSAGTRRTAGKTRAVLRYEFIVNGRVYRGEHILGAVEQRLFFALAPEVRELLETRGVVCFEDIPEEIRAILATRDITSFERIPMEIVEGLRAKGYSTDSEMPGSLREALRNKDYAAAASELDKMLPRLAPPSESPSAHHLAGEARSARIAGSRTVSLSTAPRGDTAFGRPLYVFYNPGHPREFVLSYLGWRAGNFHLMMALGTLLLAFFYGASIYPRLIPFRRR